VKRRNNRKTIWLDEQFEYNGEILTIQQGKQGVYIEMMNKTIEQLDIALQIHKRVLVHRFDLHVNYYEGNSKRLSRFMNRLKQWIKRNYGIIDIGSIWVREREESKEQHYHLALYLDGNKIQHPKKLNAQIKEMWAPHGHMPTISNPFYYIDKNNLKAKRLEAIYRVSYLAKVRGKGYRDEQAKDYEASRLTKNNA
jgi:hypothetical protein